MARGTLVPVGSALSHTLFGCSLLRSRCVSFRSTKTAEVIGTIISEKLMADALDDKVGQQTTYNGASAVDVSVWPQQNSCDSVSASLTDQ